MYIVQKCKYKVLFSCFIRQIFNRTMTSHKCKIAVCQMTSTNNKENNLSTVQRLIAQAAQQDAEVVFLPEACDYIGTNAEETKVLAETLEGNLVNEYKEAARKHKVWLSVGGFHERFETAEAKFKLRNAHLLINENGDIVSIYRKLHLFDVSIPEKNINLKESDMVVGGSDIVPPVATPAGLLALSICYDLRFPELSTLLRKQGADILTFPSAFTHVTGEAHWQVLLRARAIENQCYIVAAAQYGQHNIKRISHGHSLIVDPWGKIIAECPEYNPDNPTNESVAIAEVDPELLAKIRQEMPVFQHRRDDKYQLKLLDIKGSIAPCSGFIFAEKTIPTSTVFYQTKHSFAFTNIRCVVPGRILSNLKYSTVIKQEVIEYQSVTKDVITTEYYVVWSNIR